MTSSHEEDNSSELKKISSEIKISLFFAILQIFRINALLSTKVKLLENYNVSNWNEGKKEKEKELEGTAEEIKILWIIKSNCISLEDCNSKWYIQLPTLPKEERK